MGPRTGIDVLDHLFIGGRGLLPPYVGCGMDPTSDEIYEQARLPQFGLMTERSKKLLSEALTGDSVGQEWREACAEIEQRQWGN